MLQEVKDDDIASGCEEDIENDHYFDGPIGEKECFNDDTKYNSNSAILHHAISDASRILKKNIKGNENRTKRRSTMSPMKGEAYWTERMRKNREEHTELLDKLDLNKIEREQIARHLASLKAKAFSKSRRCFRSVAMTCSSTPRDFVLADITNSSYSSDTVKDLYINTSTESSQQSEYGPCLTLEEKQAELLAQLAGLNICRVNDLVEEEMATLYFHPNLKRNNVPLPVIREDSPPTFYLFNITNDDEIVKLVHDLGGKVEKFLPAASRILFNPSPEPLNRDNLILLATAAASGKLLLPLKYLNDSWRKKEFENINHYLSFDKFITSCELTVEWKALIKMAQSARINFERNGYPIFYRHHILFLDDPDFNEDVIILLQCLGAYVQIYTRKGDFFIENNTVTLMVTSGPDPQTQQLRTMIPVKSPDDLRRTLLKDLEKFKQRVLKETAYASIS